MNRPMARGAAAYYETHVQSRSPLELVVMLYDGALQSLAQAADAMERQDMARKGDALSRALAIVAELQSTLNLQEGGEVAAELDRLYSHVTERLIEANVQRQATPIREVVRLLTPLRDAWAQIATAATTAA